MTSSVVIEFAVVESERYFPIIGWGKKRLPTDRPQWASYSGKHKADREHVSSLVHPEHGLVWKGDWEIFVHASETDPEGWQYSIDFPQAFHASMKATDFVRRRSWIRIAHCTRRVRGESELQLGELHAFVKSVNFPGSETPMPLAPPTDGIHFVAEVVQSERFFPLLGWGKRRLPTDRLEWSDKTGKVHHNKDIIDQLIPRECEWLGNWVLHKRGGETDEDGWQYAVDFPQQFHAHGNPMDFVRRRYWRRVFMIKPAARDTGVLHAAEFESSIWRTEGAADKICRGCSDHLTPLNISRNCSKCNHDFCSRCAKKQSDGTWLCGGCHRAYLKQVMQQLNHSSSELWNLAKMMHDTIVHEYDADFSRVAAQEEADRQEAEKLSAARGSDRNVEARNKTIEKYSTTPDSRQGMLRISILRAIGVPTGNAQRRLRAVVRTPDGKLFRSSAVYDSKNPDFENSVAQAILSDDKQPLTVFIEEYNPKFIDVSIAGVSDTGTNIMAAFLDLRAPHEGMNRVCSENLVYYEQACAILPAVDPRDMKSRLPNNASFTVKWTLEVRELQVIGFCDNCGRTKSNCDCS